MESEARGDLAQERREETQETMEAVRGGDEAATAPEESGAGPPSREGQGVEASSGGLLPPARVAGALPPVSTAPSEAVGPAAAVASPVSASGTLEPPALDVDIDVRTRPGVGRLLDVVA